MKKTEIADRLEEMADALRQRGRFYGADGDEEALRSACDVMRALEPERGADDEHNI